MATLLTSCAHCPGPGSDLARDHLYFCAQYLAGGAYEQAEARCMLALEHDPTLAEAHNLLGLLARHRGNDEEAAREYKEALALRSEFPEALNNYGELFMDRRDYGEACGLFEQALRIDPAYVTARANFGKCLYHDKKPELARKEFLKCMEQDPDQCDCRLGLGVLAADRKAFDEALGQFTRLTEICPNGATGFYNLCWTFVEMRRCSEAVPACQRALEIDPGYLEAKEAVGQAVTCRDLVPVP
jgi:Tfp pilus assembly protein PilF